MGLYCICSYLLWTTFSIQYLQQSKPLSFIRESAAAGEQARRVSAATDLSTSALWLGLVMAAMYCMMYLLASVFPAPLSPGTKKTQTQIKEESCINILRQGLSNYILSRL